MSTKVLDYLIVVTLLGAFVLGLAGYILSV